MKLHELHQLNENEEEHTIQGSVTSLVLLKDADGKYLTGIVNVAKSVILPACNLKRLPVKFGAVGGYFNCNDNKLTLLEGAPHSIGTDFSCRNNKLTSLMGIHKIIKKMNWQLHMGKNPLTSGGIGLILIEGLKEIRADQPAFDIISKYLGQGKKGLLLCQEELIDAGYEEFAKL